MWAWISSSWSLVTCKITWWPTETSIFLPLGSTLPLAIVMLIVSADGLAKAGLGAEAPLEATGDAAVVSLVGDEVACSEGQAQCNRSGQKRRTGERAIVNSHVPVSSLRCPSGGNLASARQTAAVHLVSTNALHRTFPAGQDGSGHHRPLSAAGHGQQDPMTQA